MLTKVLLGVLAAGAIGVAGTPAAVAEKDVGWSLLPTEVEPGGTVSAMTSADNGGCYPATPVTSAGLVAPLQWTRGGNFATYSGDATAVKKPGKYTASFTCNDGRKTSRTFTVIGTPDPEPPTPTKPTPAPSKPKPTPAKPAKPQVAVKPVGAPATGGGGTADS